MVFGYYKFATNGKVKAIEKLIKQIEKFEHRYEILQMLDEVSSFYSSLDSPEAYVSALEREYGVRFENVRGVIKEGFLPGEAITRKLTIAVIQDFRDTRNVDVEKIVRALYSYYE